jgi:hypothetical protein
MGEGGADNRPNTGVQDLAQAHRIEALIEGLRTELEVDESEGEADEADVAPRGPALAQDDAAVVPDPAGQVLDLVALLIGRAVVRDRHLAVPRE